MNDIETDWQLPPAEYPVTNRVGSAGVLLGSALCALVASTALANPSESRDIREIGEGRAFVTVEPNDAWQPDGFPDALIVRAAPVGKVPVIDGYMDDPAWDEAVETTVPLAWGEVREASLKAVYTEDDIYIAVSWPDWTRDEQHHPWVWDAARGRYTEGPQVEDSLLVSIEGGCDWNASLLANQIYDFDAWVWMAARTNPLGQAVDADGNVQNKPMSDQAFVKYQSRYPDPAWNVKFIDRREGILNLSWQDLERMYKLVPPEQEIYVRYLPDGGRNSSMFAERIGPPSEPPVQVMSVGLDGSVAATGQITAPQYRPRRLTGDAGEVAAKGHWADGRWTVEFRRALVTEARTSSDSLFERTTQFSIHIFDHAERLDESSESGRLLLEFEPAGEDPVSDTTVLVTR